MLKIDIPGFNYVFTKPRKATGGVGVYTASSLNFEIKNIIGWDLMNVKIFG